MQWLSEALCRGINQDFFYPPLEEPSPNHYYAVGKQVCNGCSAWKQCLQAGLDNEEVWGMWGGVTPQERRRKDSLRHGTLEAKRLGCKCADCQKANYTNKPVIDIKTLPKSGESYDIKSLVFSTTKRR